MILARRTPLENVSGAILALGTPLERVSGATQTSSSANWNHLERLGVIQDEKKKPETPATHPGGGSHRTGGGAWGKVWVDFGRLESP